jgi:hypothetical protein
VLEQGGDVDDQADGAVGHDRGSGQAGPLAGDLAQRLEHDLVLAHELIDGQGHLGAARPDHDQVDEAAVVGDWSGRGGSPRALSSCSTGMTRSRSVRTLWPRTRPNDFGSTRSVSTTPVSGRAQTRAPDLTSRAPMMASVSGSDSETRVPWPGVLVTSTQPPRCSMLLRTTSMPTPRPETSVTTLAVEKPGMKMTAGSRRRSWLGLLAGHQALLDDGPAQRGGIHALAVVLDGDQDAAVGVAGGQAHGRRERLAERAPLVGRLDAVVQGVADQVAQRVADLFEDGPVELGLLAFDDQLDFLVEAHGDVAHDTREAVEDGLDRQHAQAGDLILELAGDAGELLRILVGLAGQRIVAEPDGQELGALLQAGLVDDQLADEVHQFVEAGDVDADGLLGGLEAIARDGHPLALGQAASFRAQVGLAALGRGREVRRSVLVVGAGGAERRDRVVRAVDVDAERRLGASVSPSRAARRRLPR